MTVLVYRPRPGTPGVELAGIGQSPQPRAPRRRRTSSSTHAGGRAGSNTIADGDFLPRTRLYLHDSEP